MQDLYTSMTLVGGIHSGKVVEVHAGAHYLNVPVRPEYSSWNEQDEDIGPIQFSVDEYIRVSLTPQHSVMLLMDEVRTEERREDTVARLLLKSLRDSYERTR